MTSEQETKEVLTCFKNTILSNIIIYWKLSLFLTSSALYFCFPSKYECTFVLNMKTLQENEQIDPMIVYIK